MAKAADIKLQIAQMKNQLENFLPVFRDIKRFLLPERGVFDRNLRNDEILAPDYRAILDDSATAALDVITAGVFNGLTPPSKKWFDLYIKGMDAKTDYEASVWLDSVSDYLSQVFISSNFYEVLPIIFKEAIAFGTAACGVFFDAEEVIRIYPYTAGEYYIAQDNKGRVDTFGRKYTLTLKDFVEIFGEDKLPQTQRFYWEQRKTNKKMKIFSLCKKNIDKERDDDGLIRKFITYNVFDTEIFSKTGNDYFPYVIARWEKGDNWSAYGVGAGMRGLGHIKTLQRLQSDSLLAVEKGINPPVQINASKNLKSIIDLGAGGKSFVASNGGNAPAISNAYSLNFDLKSVEYKIEQARMLINKTFAVDVFLTITGQNKEMTAKEVMALESERMLRFGSIFQRLTNECVGRLIENTFEIAMKANVLPPVPESLENRKIEIKYNGILAQAQVASEVTVYNQALVMIAQAAQVAPDVMDKINMDEYVDFIAKSFNVDTKLLNSDDTVQQIRMQRAQAQQAAAQQQAALTLADVAQKAGSAKIEPDTLLGKMAANQ